MTAHGALAASWLLPVDPQGAEVWPMRVGRLSHLALSASWLLPTEPHRAEVVP